jgi:hypothetical protein
VAPRPRAERFSVAAVLAPSIPRDPGCTINHSHMCPRTGLWAEHQAQSHRCWPPRLDIVPPLSHGDLVPRIDEWTRTARDSCCPKIADCNAPQSLLCLTLERCRVFWRVVPVRWERFTCRPKWAEPGKGKPAESGDGGTTRVLNANHRPSSPDGTKRNNRAVGMISVACNSSVA